MVLRLIFRYLANNEQLVQRLSESFIIRRAARFCVSAFYRTKIFAEEKGIKDIDSTKLRSILQRFSENMKKEIKSAKDELQKPK